MMKHGFICNICLESTSPEKDDILRRELRACSTCGSNARFRSLMRALSIGLYGDVRAVSQFNLDMSIRGFGCSDSNVYAARLATLFDYKNTFYHAEPFVDICNPTTLENFEGSNFIICSDVIEHTLGTPRLALRNMYEALKPGGFLILSAPTYDMVESIEKYPSLNNYETVKLGDEYAVVYSTKHNSIGMDPAPFFHGGPGLVLEMRLFSHKMLLDDVRWAGFTDVTIPEEGNELYGADWPNVVERQDMPYETRAHVILARKTPL